MKTVMDRNITPTESYRRYAIGVLILAGFLMNPGLPAWMALIALYPFSTAFNRWDPLNAIFDAVIRFINLRRIKQAAETLAVNSVRA